MRKLAAGREEGRLKSFASEDIDAACYVCLKCDEFLVWIGLLKRTGATKEDAFRMLTPVNELSIAPFSDQEILELIERCYAF